MSEQRKKRQELRQGFHQFAMGMYQSYLETHNVDEAKVIVAEAIKEQLRLFMADEPTYGESVKDIINARVEEFTAILNQSEGYDQQLFYSEKIDTLTGALEILENR
jgi:ABC-type antimicrobial peptide transport system ATPase subunit